MTMRLPDEYMWRIQKSDGYMDLKMLDRAREELARVPAPYTESLAYRQTRVRLALEDQDWATAAEIAGNMREAEPDHVSHWIQLAFATRRLKDIDAARGILLNAVRQFPDEPIIHFNLACYECQLGRHTEAMHYLEKAFKLDPHYREIALEDQDLEPLWTKI